MIKKIISIAFVLSLLTSQTIIHDPVYTLQPGKAFQVEASIIGYLGPQSDATATLFYRSYGQETFFNSKMTYINGKYKFSIPASFIKGAIEYYIILEINNVEVECKKSYDNATIIFLNFLSNIRNKVSNYSW